MMALRSVLHRENALVFGHHALDPGNPGPD